MQKISAHRIDLPFNGIAGNCPLGPAFGYHGTDPHILNREQSWHQIITGGFYRCPGFKPIAVQCKVLSFRNDAARKNGLKLRPDFKSLHTKPY